MSAIPEGFARRLLDLRKRKGWSQPRLGKKAGASDPIIGRYERGEMTPSIEMAKKLADAFGVTLDYLVSDKEVPNILQDKAMLNRWKEVDTLTPPVRERILSVLVCLVRDAKARQAYQATGMNTRGFNDGHRA